MLKNLKSLFIVSDNNNDDEEKTIEESPKDKTEILTPTNNPDNETPIPPPSVEEVTPTPAPPKGIPENRFIEALLKSFEDNNLDGFDYLEYKNGLKAMEELNMDDATRYRAAFATAATMGVDVDTLIKSTVHYLNVLGEEQKKFDTALKQKNTDSIVKKTEEHKQIAQTIEDKKAQIDRLNEEIIAHEEELTVITSYLHEAKAKIAMTEGSFNASYEMLVDQIKTDILRMKQYLK